MLRLGFSVLSLMVYLFYYLHKPYLPTFEYLHSDTIDSQICFYSISRDLRIYFPNCIYTDLFCFFYVFFLNWFDEMSRSAAFKMTFFCFCLFFLNWNSKCDTRAHEYAFVEWNYWRVNFKNFACFSPMRCKKAAIYILK